MTGSLEMSVCMFILFQFSITDDNLLIQQIQVKVKLHFFKSYNTVLSSYTATFCILHCLYTWEFSSVLKHCTLRVLKAMHLSLVIYLPTNFSAKYHHVSTVHLKFNYRGCVEVTLLWLLLLLWGEV